MWVSDCAISWHDTIVTGFKGALQQSDVIFCFQKTLRMINYQRCHREYQQSIVTISREIWTLISWLYVVYCDITLRPCYPALIFMDAIHPKSVDSDAVGLHGLRLCICICHFYISMDYKNKTNVNYWTFTSAMFFLSFCLFTPPSRLYAKLAVASCLLCKQVNLLIQRLPRM